MRASRVPSLLDRPATRRVAPAPRDPYPSGVRAIIPAMTDPAALGRSAPTDPDAGEHITINGKVYLVVPQKLGRLRSQLGVVFSALAGAAQSGGDLDTVSILREKPYELLKVFLPDLEPEWALWGAVTAEAYEAGDFDEDRGATFPELHRAFTTALRVNHFDLFKVLGNFFSPELVRRAINVQMANFLEQTLTSSSSERGPASVSLA